MAACIGTKEFVAGCPHWLRLRDPERDTVLYPAVSYPTYAMGAELAGCRAVPVPVDDDWRLDLAAIDPADADAGAVPLGEHARQPRRRPRRPGRGRGVGSRPRRAGASATSATSSSPGTARRRTILEHGPDGVLAVHSLSKRSNLAGVRAGFYAGDAELVHYLREVRKHAGFMVPGPVQAAAVAALGDDAHVDEQRDRYRQRLERSRDALRRRSGSTSPLPGGGFYLWVPAPGGDAWALAERLAAEGGAWCRRASSTARPAPATCGSPSCRPDDRIELVVERLRAG